MTKRQKRTLDFALTFPKLIIGTCMKLARKFYILTLVRSIFHKAVVFLNDHQELKAICKYWMRRLGIYRVMIDIYARIRLPVASDPSKTTYQPIYNPRTEDVARDLKIAIATSPRKDH
jgi:hypothetical protein